MHIGAAALQLPAAWHVIGVTAPVVLHVMVQTSPGSDSGHAPAESQLRSISRLSKTPVLPIAMEGLSK
jgi:hypothetical protein